MTSDVFQVAGAALGIIGSILVASLSSNIRCVAFTCWIISNVLIGTVYVVNHMWPLFFMVCVYTLTSSLGLINNWPRKAKP